MGGAWVFPTRGPLLDSRQNMVVSGRASDLKCSCATLLCKSVDHTNTWYKKAKSHQGFSQSITRYRDHSIT